MRLFILILFNCHLAYPETNNSPQLCSKKENCKNIEDYKILNPKLKPTDQLNSIYDVFDKLEVNNSKRSYRKPVEQPTPTPIKPIGSGSESKIP